MKNLEAVIAAIEYIEAHLSDEMIDLDCTTQFCSYFIHYKYPVLK